MTALSIPVPEISVKEVLYYMRAGQDESARTIAEEGVSLVRRAADCKIVYERFPFSRTDDTVTIGSWTIRSKSLSAHLKECREVVVFGATAGIGVDRVITASGNRSGALSLAVDSAGGVLVEAVCDRLEELIGGKRVFRYSPGYGDFPLLEQREMADLLKLEKTIGVTLTEGLMLRPTKSVTAIIGIL